MKFRKKPVVVEAEQWLGPECLGKIVGVRKATEQEVDKHIAYIARCKVVPETAETGRLEIDETRRFFVIDTLEGFHFVTPGDWIITGVAQEKYPCKPDIFEATYERVPDPKPYETPADD